MEYSSLQGSVLGVLLYTSSYNLVSLFLYERFL